MINVARLQRHAKCRAAAEASITGNVICAKAQAGPALRSKRQQRARRRCAATSASAQCAGGSSCCAAPRQEALTRNSKENPQRASTKRTAQSCVMPKRKQMRANQRQRARAMT